MTEKSKDLFPDMSYAVGDIFNMKYKRAAFDMIMDKGCLDAVYPEESKENHGRIEGFFKDIWRVLAPGGSYFAISLFQDFILDHLIQHFQPQPCVIRIYELGTKDKLVPFAFVVEKIPDATEEGSIFF